MPLFFTVFCAATLAFAPEPLATCQLRTAPWYGPSAMMVRGLTLWADARDIRLEREDVTLAAVGQDPWATPGQLRCFIGDDVVAQPVSRQGLQVLDEAINRAWLALEPPELKTDGNLCVRFWETEDGSEEALNLLALAVLRDDAAAVQTMWPRDLSAADRQKLIATAAAAGSTQVLGRIAPLRASALNALSDAPLGNHPLHYAALSGQNQTLLLLLASGASPSVTNALGTQPLHDAARAGSSACIAALLDYGAQVTALTSSGDTVLHRLAMFGCAQQAEAYTAALQALVSPMMLKWGRSEVREFLNMPNKDGFTALDLAVATRQDDVASALRQHGGHHSTGWFRYPARRWNRDTVRCRDAHTP